jgi:hypothetical protein
VVGEAHDAARRHVHPKRTGGVREDQDLGAQRLERLEGQAHRGGVAAFVVVGAAPEDGDAASLQVSHDEVGAVARDAGMGEAVEVAVGNGGSVDRLREVAEARAEDQAHAHRFLARVGADVGGEGVSVP